MTEQPKTPPAEFRGSQTVSKVASDGSLVELVYDPAVRKTQLARYYDGTVTLADAFDLPGEERVIPVPARNNLIRHGALLLPEKAEPFASVATLIRDIDAYLYRYVDLSREFGRIATAYVLLSWVYDAFNELPYLRFRGDYGSGKTRALLIVGSVCYKPFFASGASTVSPIFHTLDTFAGTLIVDETDFRFSDEKAELVKIFNNGNVRGFPVLRTRVTPAHAFDPRAFSVFGPKIVAMRHSFDDPALESRFLTEDMGKRPLRADIPINLPDVQQEDARRLRNQLLWYRFTMLKGMRIDTGAYDADLSPRLNQILAPLLSVSDDDKLRDDIRLSAKTMEQSLRADRSASPEAQVLEVVLSLSETKDRRYIAVAEITGMFIKRFGSEYERPITPRYIGYLLRNRLRLYTYKRHGNYVLPPTQAEHLAVLAERYGIAWGQSSDSEAKADNAALPQTDWAM